MNEHIELVSDILNGNFEQAAAWLFTLPASKACAVAGRALLATEGLEREAIKRFLVRHECDEVAS